MRKSVRVRTVAAVLGTLLLAACGTMPRAAFTPLQQAAAEPAGLADVRFNAGDAHEALGRSTVLSERRTTRRDFAVLSLSGGGANGAYGAGVLKGWTGHGDRPEFDVVTGVSTGALAAPFAYLGPSWDDRLEEAYTSGEVEGLISLRSMAALVAPAFFSADPVRRLVEKYVTPGMLRAVAAEHARGRRLLVATTNLDTQETVIWDMGAIATRGDDKALTLFQDVLVASAAIPGVFPPVMIESEGPGGPIREMHADGGVTAPFVSVPESLMLWTAPDGAQMRGRLYVLINGQMGSTFGITKGNLVGILARSYDAMSKASTRTLLLATAAFAERNNLSLQITAVPDDTEASGLNMRRLFRLGRERAAAGEACTTPAATP